MSAKKINPGYRVLAEIGAIPKGPGSLMRQKTVDCIGCQWAETCDNPEGPRATNAQIARCVGDIASASSVLKRLEKVRIIRREKGKITLINAFGKGPSHTMQRDGMIITPADTPVGQVFAEAVAPPDRCLQLPPEVIDAEIPPVL
jgi:hypothetical protein